MKQMKNTRAVLVLFLAARIGSCSPLNAQSPGTAALVEASNDEVLKLVSETQHGGTAIRPTPQIAMSSADYPVTAGDVYLLALSYNGTPTTFSIPVDTTYKIRIGNFGVLDAKGLTYTELKKQVETIVTKNMPLSGVQFVLSTPAVFTVTIKGEVRETTIREAWPLTRLSEAVQGTLTGYSSERKVEVVSQNGRRKTYDLFKAKRFGDLNENPYVKPGDVITISRVNRKVSVAGAVERPGTYELLPNENLKALLDHYGGSITDFADTDNMVLERYDQSGKATKTIYLPADAIQNDTVLMDNDRLYVPTTAERRPIMFVEGAIYISGTSTNIASMNRASIQFDAGTDYTTLLRKNKRFFSASDALHHAYIIRGNKTIAIDVYQIIYDYDTTFDEIVQPFDVLEIPFEQYYVSVAGAVNLPGRYPYIEGRTWEYYIGLAGGFNKNLNTGDSITILDKDGKPLSKDGAITPETTITAETNSFNYRFGTIMPAVTSILSIISTGLSLFMLISNAGK